jgi:hypothetical protein
MRQGRQKVISYKVHKRMAIAEDEWVSVENVVPPIIEREVFDKAQALNERDMRAAPGKRNVHLFAGFLRCADCKKTMVRNETRGHVYYACRTYRQQTKDRCGRHTIKSEDLTQAVLVSIQKHIDLVSSLSDIIEEINNAPVIKTESNRLTTLLKQKSGELQKASNLLDGIYFDWKSGEITHDQYRRMKPQFEEQVERLKEQIAHIEEECQIMACGIDTQDPYLTTFLKYRNIQSLSRALLVDLVNAIYIHEDGTVEIVFNFADQYRRIVEFVENNKNDLYVIGGNAV